MAFCSNCGSQIGDESKFCPNCGKTLDAQNAGQQQTQTTQTSQPNYQQGYQPNYQQTQTKPKLNIMALVGFILGCVSILINFWGIVGIIALVFSIVGYTQIKNTGNGGKGLAITGIILGAIGVVWGFISLILLGSLY